MTVTVIFLRYEVKDSVKIRHFETTPLFFDLSGRSATVAPKNAQQLHKIGLFVQLLRVKMWNNCTRQFFETTLADCFRAMPFGCFTSKSGAFPISVKTC